MRLVVPCLRKGEGEHRRFAFARGAARVFDPHVPRRVEVGCRRLRKSPAVKLSGFGNRVHRVGQGQEIAWTLRDAGGPDRCYRGTVDI